MSMRPDQRRAYLDELARAEQATRDGRHAEAFAHLERAHIISQRHPGSHTYVHWRMWLLGFKRGDRRELLGQPMRMLAALTKSLVWVPKGNTGGANVNPLQPMPVPDDLIPYVD